MAKLLVIEDEEAVRTGITEILMAEKYEVVACEDGVCGLEKFKTENADLVILDVMMPKMDGFEVLRQIRAVKSMTPVLMLTAKAAEVDKVVGLEIGADDYLTKPFSMREFLARVKALLRRSAVKAANGDAQLAELATLTIGSVVIDFKSYRAHKGEMEIDLSAKEYDLLKCLASRPDIPVSRNQLLDEVWGYNSYPTTRTVDNFIARLRRKVEDEPENPRHILTVHGVGYKFVQ
ncbi:MAG: response regulator transcription factor [Deltaproteobacteria bacterium]|nr:response regulator transcription factor [Deltaproteobacteria bacterium]